MAVQFYGLETVEQLKEDFLGTAPNTRRNSWRDRGLRKRTPNRVQRGRNCKFELCALNY